MIKAIFFDYDDTLGNRELAAYDLYKDLLRSYIDDEFRLEAAVQDVLVYEQYGNCNKRMVQDQLEQKYDITLDFDLHSRWFIVFPEYSVLFDDTIETLEHLKKKYRLGVITNGPEASQVGKIERTGIRDYFELIVTSETVGCDKPDERIFRYAAEQMGLDISECVYVGDVFSNDVYGAMMAGMKAVWLWRRGFRKCEYDVVRIEKLSELMDLY